MNIYDKTHPHNALYLQCCAAAMRGSPLTLQALSDFDGWVDYAPLADGLYPVKMWNCESLRTKPPELVMVTRTVAYPAPMAVEPELGTKYFLCVPSGISTYTWCGNPTNEKWLAAGVCHLTRAAAQAQWDAFYGVQE